MNLNYITIEVFVMASNSYALLCVYENYNGNKPQNGKKKEKEREKQM